MKLSDYVWRFVSEYVAKHVFMFPGGGAMHLVDSLGNNKSLTYIPMLHEQACAMAAETYARMTYHTGVILVTTGPGGTNAITGVAAAWLESTPLLVISGQAKTTDLKDGYGVRQRGNQEVGITEIVSSITKYAVTVKHPEDIRRHLEQAIYEANDGRKGPVWIDIPLDIQAAEIEAAKLKGFYQRGRVESVENIRAQWSKQIPKVISLLAESKRPVIIAGQGIERNRGREIFRRLVEYLRIPVLLSWMAVDLLEEEHPYNAGRPGMVAPRYSNKVMQESDLIIAVGTRLDPAMIGYNPKDFAPGAKKVIVDIDLNEVNKFEFDVAEKVQADASEFLEAVFHQVQTSGYSGEQYSDWVNRLTRYKNEYPVVLPAYRRQEEKVNPYFFMETLFDELDDDDVIQPGSSGNCIDFFYLCMKNKRYQRIICTGALGSMGYALPAAIGACIGSGHRTVCVEGDGSFQLNIQELATIAGRRLPIKIFVVENGGYLSIMNMQRNHFTGHYVASNPKSGLYFGNIEKIAKAYGLHTISVSSHAQLKGAIRETLEIEGPAICVVHMMSDTSVQPKVMSYVGKDGSMVSGSLDNMWPPLA